MPVFSSLVILRQSQPFTSANSLIWESVTAKQMHTYIQTSSRSVVEVDWFFEAVQPTVNSLALTN